MSSSKSFLSNIDRSVCFVVDKRINDWPTIRDNLVNVGFPNVQMFLSGGDNLPGLPYDRVNINELPPTYPNSTHYPNWYTHRAYNAWLSRRQVLEQCLLTNTKIVGLFEDDIFIENDFTSIIDDAADYLSCLNWDMLYFGCYNFEGSSLSTSHPNVRKLRGSGGWHGLLLKRKIIAELLAFNAIGPWDEISGKYLHNIYNAYAIYPCVISQNSGFSWIENTNLTKPSRFTK